MWKKGLMWETRKKTQSKNCSDNFKKITRMYGIDPREDYPHTSRGHRLPIMIKVQMEMVKKNKLWCNTYSDRYSV